MEGTKKKVKSRSFQQYLWNSEIYTTWINLIGWPHKTSSIYYLLFQNFVKNNLRNLGKISGIFWVAFHKSRKSLSSLWATWSNNGVDVIFFSRSLVQFLGLTKHFSVSSTSAVEWIEPAFYSFLTVSFSLNFLFFKFSFLCLQRHLSSGHEVWFDKCCSENTKWSPT